jgi:hypothetical protein
MEDAVDWITNAYNGFEDFMIKLTLIVMAILVLTVLIALSILWDRWASLPRPIRIIILTAVDLALLTTLFALVPEVPASLERHGIPTSLESATTKATHLWRTFDGFTRSHPEAGGLLFCLFVVLWLFPDTPLLREKVGD